MNLLFHFGHPAHVHHFKNIIYKLNQLQHKILVVAQEKEIVLYLLEKYGIEYVKISRNKVGYFNKMLNMVKNIFLVIKIARKFKPDILVGRASPLLAVTSKIFRRPFLSFSDTEHAKINYIFAFPFATKIITPKCFIQDLGEKHIRFDGYFEQCYLDPKYFDPDPYVLNFLGVKKGGKYVILRFVSWAAIHDIGHSGLSLQIKKQAVKELSKYAKVFISSEGELPEDLKQYQIKIPPEKMHDILYFATLYVGEGATMASECAMLGTPAIYVNSLTSGTLEEQQEYGLIYGFRNSKGVLESASELIQMPNIKQEYKKRRQKILSEKIDVTQFMVWFVENYPKSFEQMKVNPEYQYNFK